MQKPRLKVELQYFKRSGKYYTSAEFETDNRPLYQIFEEVRQMQKCGVLPGLKPSLGQRSEFMVLINVPEHEFAHPQLLP